MPFCMFLLSRKQINFMYFKQHPWLLTICGKYWFYVTVNVANIHNYSCRYRTVTRAVLASGLVSLFLISMSDFSVPLFLLLQATIQNCVFLPDIQKTVTLISCLESGSFRPWVI